jgi:large conductance mechanosensitive channel
MSVASEFKEFAMKGSVVDLAVGVIVGAAFGKIVSSLVGDVITPVLGKAIGGVNFTDLAISLGTDPKGAAVLVKYGSFLQTIFDFVIFVIIAFVLFISLRGINKLKKPAPAAPAEAPPPPRQEVLLEEIRDALRKGR